MCINKTFGFNCSETCGFCAGAPECHPVTGDCLWECMPGYTGAACLEGKDRTSLSENNNSESLRPAFLPRVVRTKKFNI